MTKLEKESLALLTNIELLIRVNSPMADGSAMHKAVKKLVKKLEVA